MIGRPISVLAPREREDEVPAILEKIRHGQRVGYLDSMCVTKDKRTLNVSISVSPIYDADGKVVGASTLAAISPRRKRSRINYGRRRKWRRWGRSPGGVARDFNNLWGIVTACSELLRSRVDQESLEYIDNIRETAKRGASLTRQLLAFSRRQPVQTQLLDLNDRLKEVTKLLRALMGDD